MICEDEISDLSRFSRKSRESRASDEAVSCLNG